MNYLRLNQIAVEKMTVKAALKHWQLGVFVAKVRSKYQNRWLFALID